MKIFFLLVLLCTLTSVNIYADQSEWSAGLAYKRHDFTYEYYDSKHDSHVATKHSGFSFGPAVNYEKAMWDIVFIRLFSKLALGNVNTTVLDKQQTLTGHSSIFEINGLFELGYVKTFEKIKVIPYIGLDWNSACYNTGYGEIIRLWPSYSLNKIDSILGTKIKIIKFPVDFDFNLKKSMFNTKSGGHQKPDYHYKDHVFSWQIGSSLSVLVFDKFKISPGYDYTSSSSGEHVKKNTRHDFVLNLMWII